jgi:hypothetical protein
MVKALLVTGKLVKPGNFSVTVNFLGSQLRFVGLGISRAKVPLPTEVKIIGV